MSKETTPGLKPKKALYAPIQPFLLKVFFLTGIRRETVWFLEYELWTKDQINSGNYSATYREGKKLLANVTRKMIRISERLFSSLA